MIEGIIIRGYSGFYYVQTNDSIYECSLRGRYRLKKQDFLPGDRVMILPRQGEGKGVIEELLPRKVELLRPAIANVNQAILVIPLNNKQPDLMLLDRLLIMTTNAGIRPIICFNKVDLADENVAADLKQLYQKIGYQTILTSAKKEIGIQELKNELYGNISVFAGPSGVGKSSLLNAVEPGLELQTGEVSRKSQRGRHTTRYTSLLALKEGGFVADSPGFSCLHLPEMKREELASYFPEFSLQQQCKFTTCLHHTEPECAVKQALEEGKIDPRRYEHYLDFLVEVIAKERSY
ncbi:ribosome small subunit-dependent GTPase A [Bacillota bacterium LX-D]|nr:ribosome small subunit-dependent GTPase A [Bacillota bacterium LX-D]